MTRAIVVGTDGSKTASEAVRQATDLASSSGAKLFLVTAYHDSPVLRERTTVWTNEPKGVVDTGRPGGEARTETVNLHDIAESVLKRAAKDAVSKGVDVETYAREGHPADVIIDVAKQEHADLIVVGSRGLTDLRRYLLGSVSTKVSQHAPCSVMIVRSD